MLDQAACQQLLTRTDLGEVVQLELNGEIAADVLAEVAPRFSSLRAIVWRHSPGVASAHLIAFRSCAIEELGLIDSRIADQKLFRALSDYEHLARLRLTRVQGLGPGVLGEAMRLPSLAELDLRGLRGLGRREQDVLLAIDSRLLLEQLAHDGPAPRASVQLRLSGGNGTPWSELVRLAKLRSARLDLTGVIDSSLIPSLPSGSDLTPDQQRLTTAQAMVRLDVQLRERFKLVD